jgi:predicted MFS family arabinose efflux permease
MGDGEPPGPKRLNGRTRLALAGLVITQIIGWGTTFNMPAVLGQQIATSLAISREMVFGGVGLMLIVSALVSPEVGRRIDAFGGHGVMAIGSGIAGCALLFMAGASDVFTWLLAWTLAGIALPMTVSIGAFAALARVAGPNARRAISTLLLFTGFSATVFWPIGGYLDVQFGWRITLIVFAALHLLICLPIHFGLLRGDGRGLDERGQVTHDSYAEGTLAVAKRPRAFILLAITLICNGVLGWGLTLQLIDLLEAFGLLTAVAIIVASIQGPAQFAARFLDWSTGNRITPMTAGVSGACLFPVAFVLPLLFPGSLPAAIAFVALFGFATGLMSLARLTLPLELFGARGYGAFLGKLNVPQNLAFAASPIVYAATLQRIGPHAALLLSVAVGIIAVVAILMLERLCRLHETTDRGPG